MEKISTVEQSLGYRIIEKINENIVVVRFASGNEGILNLTKNSFIGNIEYTECIYDSNKKFVALINRPGIKNNDSTRKETISIYDIENNRVVVKNGEYEYPYNNYNTSRNLFVYKHADGYHIFDSFNPEFRKNCFWNLYKPSIYNDALVVIKNNGNQGIYKPKRGLIIQPNYSIFRGSGSLQDFLVIRDGQKHAFMYENDDATLTPFYDTIKFDVHDFIICEKEKSKDVYDKLNKKLLASINCEEIEYVIHFGSRTAEKEVVEYIFKIKNNGKYGLIKISKNEKKDIYTEILDMSSYKDILFYSDTIWISTKEKIYLYDYNKKLIKIISGDSEINEIDEYNKDKLVKFFPANKVLYATPYDGKYGNVVVNSYSQSKYDKICESIEQFSEEDFEKTLVSKYEDDKEEQKRYPTLVKKK